MALPETLNPATPADVATVASIPGFIRAVKQYLADAFGFPTTLNSAPFSISAGGVVTLQQSGALVVADPTTALGIASKQYVDARTAAGGGYGSANLGAPVGVGSVLGTILSVNLTAPASGGPYRLLASYAIALTNAGANDAVGDFQVTDGTHQWAIAEKGIAMGKSDGVNAFDVSPTTYLANAAVTLTLQGKLVSGNLFNALVTSGGLLTTFLRGIFVPSS